MKSKLFFAAAAVAALGLGSCSQDQVLEQSPAAKGKAIEFGTYLGNTPGTRGVVTSGANFDEFAVTAFTGVSTTTWSGTTDKAPDFFYNQKVVKAEANKWEYNPVKYWPTATDATITFFAHHPVDNENVKLSLPTKTGTPTVTVTTPDDPKEMVDFIADAQHNLKYNTTTTGSSPDEVTAVDKVEFKLNHEMTRLSLTAALDDKLADDNKTTVVIKSITLNATDIFAKKGVYTFANTADVAAGDDGTGAKTTLGAWTVTGNTAATLELNKYLNFNQNMTYSGKTYPGYTVGLHGKDAVNLVDQLDVTGADKQYLFFIPTSGEEGVSSVKVVVDYEIVTADNSLMTGYSYAEAKKEITITSAILAQGKAYKIDLQFHVDKVELSASVAADWTETAVTTDMITYSSADYTPAP